MIGLNNRMKKEFRPTYLCIKTHTVTGLKYFCKTTKHNYETYMGSGIYWRNHLKEHGNTITTELLGFFTNKDECVAAALKFSEDNNIVHAVNEGGKKIWANQIVENGLDGGATWFGPRPQEMVNRIAEKNKGKKRSPEVREKCRQNSLKGRKRKSGEWRQSEEAKQIIREKRALQVITKESREKAAEKLRGRKRPDVAEKLRGKIKTPETIAKMKAAQQNKGPVSEGTKQKIKQARNSQINVFPIGEYLKGKVIVVDKSGNKKSIPKEVYYAQTGPKEEWEWISHKSKEARMRRG